MNLGDIYWVEFPTGAGRAQAGRRPAIVLQDEIAVAGLPTILVIPLTSQQDALRFPGTVLIEPDADNGLPRISVALVFQLTAIDKRFLSDFLGKASDQTIAEIRSALDELTGRLTSV